jgi:putative ABC transport system substrate-binding protein
MGVRTRGLDIKASAKRGALAQQQTKPTVIWFDLGPGSAPLEAVEAFRRGLAQVGFSEGRDVTIEHYNADGHAERLPALADDLVRRRVAVIVAAGIEAALPAKVATTTIPIVFATGSDPVALGLVVSLNRPGANVTGIVNLGAELLPKQLQLLHELLPNVPCTARDLRIP